MSGDTEPNRHIDREEEREREPDDGRRANRNAGSGWGPAILTAVVLVLLGWWQVSTLGNEIETLREDLDLAQATTNQQRADQAIGQLVEASLSGELQAPSAFVRNVVEKYQAATRTREAGMFETSNEEFASLLDFIRDNCDPVDDPGCPVTYNPTEPVGPQLDEVMNRVIGGAEG